MDARQPDRRRAKAPQRGDRRSLRPTLSFSRAEAGFEKTQLPPALKPQTMM